MAELGVGEREGMWYKKAVVSTMLIPIFFFLNTKLGYTGCT